MTIGQQQKRVKYNFYLIRSVLKKNAEKSVRTEKKKEESEFELVQMYN